jgi:hypothetical protein
MFSTHSFFDACNPRPEAHWQQGVFEVQYRARKGAVGFDSTEV